MVRVMIHYLDMQRMDTCCQDVSETCSASARCNAINMIHEYSTPKHNMAQSQTNIRTSRPKHSNAESSQA